MIPFHVEATLDLSPSPLAIGFICGIPYVPYTDSAGGVAVSPPYLSSSSWKNARDSVGYFIVLGFLCLT